MNSLEKRFHNRFTAHISKLNDFTPGLKVQVYSRGVKKIDYELGKTYKYYDLASLTKILFSVTAAMNLVSNKKLDLNQKISFYLKDFKQNAPVYKLLNHTAGFLWWYPFYKDLSKISSLDGKHQQLYNKIRSGKVSSQKKSVYSDLDFFILGFILETVYQKPLLDIWYDLKDLMPPNSLHFNVHNEPKYDRIKYAPTEKCPWRKKTLQGEVHDDNTWSLNGVGPHAGLFGTIDDVSSWGLQLRKGLSSGNAIASSLTIKHFCKRSLPHARGDWALGFMMPAKTNSSVGHYLSSETVGHLGFTGTSFWFDKKNDLMVTILSNRVHPTRKNVRFNTLRPLIHNLVFETVRSI